MFVEDTRSPPRSPASLPPLLPTATLVFKAQSPEKKSQQGTAAPIMRFDKDHRSPVAEPLQAEIGPGGSHLLNAPAGGWRPRGSASNKALQHDDTAGSRK